MHLVNFLTSGNGEHRTGLLDGDVVIDLRSVATRNASGEESLRHLPTSVDDYLKADNAEQQLLRSNAARLLEIYRQGGSTDVAHAAEDVTFLPPVLAPGKIIAAGRNFHGHFAESKEGWGKEGVKVEVPQSPRGFVKVSSTLTGHRQPVVVPYWIHQVDYEVEVVAVIGRRADNISSSEALDYIAGYTVGNDVSAREIQFTEMRNGGGIVAGKNPRTFGPMGPALVTADEIDNPQDVRLWSKVNGEVRQDASTADMVFSFAELVSWYSQIGLDPGDMIMSGTPAGVGIWGGEGKALLAPGDVVTCGADGIGVLENTVVAA